MNAQGDRKLFKLKLVEFYALKKRTKYLLLKFE